jgi:hypothetical protein
MGIEMADKSDLKESSPPTDGDKLNAVLAVLQGKTLTEEANRLQVGLAEITVWLNDFVTAGTAALKSTPAGATNGPSKRRVAVAVLLVLCLAGVTGVATADVFSDRKIYLGRFALSIPKDTEFGRKDNGSYELFGVSARANARHLIMTPRSSAIQQITQAVDEWFPAESRACLIGAPVSGGFQGTKTTWAAQRYVQSYYRAGGPVTAKFVGYLVLFVERDGGALVLDVYGNKNSPNHNGGWQDAHNYLVRLAGHLEPQIRTDQFETLDSPRSGVMCLGPAILQVPAKSKAKQGRYGGFHIASNASEAAADIAYRRMVSSEQPNAPKPHESFDSIKKRWFSPTNCVRPLGGKLEYAVQPEKDPSSTFPVGTRVQQRYEKRGVDGKVATHGILAVVSFAKAAGLDIADSDRHENGDAIVIDVFARGAASGPNAWKSVNNYMQSIEKKILPDAILRPLVTSKSVKSPDGDGQCPWTPSHT